MRHCEFWSTGRVLSNRDELGRFIEGHRHRSEESKQKIKEKLIGVPFTEERLEKIRKANKENPSMLGKHHSKKTIEKMSKSQKLLNKDLSGVNNPFYGKQHTEETRMKISLNKKGKHQSIDTEFKIGHIPYNKGKRGLQIAWNKGKSWNKKTREKISESLREYNKIRREQ